MFSFFAFFGWILEFFYRGIRCKKVLNPGFMNGCVLPLYGIGAVICDIICNIFEHVNSNYNVIWTLLIAIFILSVLEFTTGLILDKVFYMKLWDYSKYMFNLKGYICLQYSLMWGLLFLIYYRYAFPVVGSVVDSFFSNSISIFLLGLFYGVFIVDLSFSIGLLGSITRYSKTLTHSINIENLRFDLLKKIKKGKVIHSIFPYSATSRFLRDKEKEK